MFETFRNHVEDVGLWLWTLLFFFILPITLSYALIRWAFF